MNNMYFSLLPSAEIISRLQDSEVKSAAELYLKHCNNLRVREEIIKKLRMKLLDLGYLNCPIKDQPTDSLEQNLVVLSIIVPIREDNRSHIIGLLNIFSFYKKFVIFS
ncbi:MAG: hypothetical protein ACK42K_12050 [Leptonema sp. (in: bacteria)]